MAKHWTQVQPTSDNTLDADGYNKELITAASSATSLDRTQIPTLGITRSNLEDYALHKVWLYDLSDFSTNGAGEQTAYRDTGGYAYNWASASYDNYYGETAEIASFELTGCKEGLYHIEWAGSYQVFKYWDLCAPPYNGKKLSVSIRFNGATVLETWGFTRPMGSFRLTGVGFGQTGTNTLSFHVQYTGAGRNDPVFRDTTTVPWMQWHLATMKALVIGRWR